jgi:glycosyltransferase involved in cell wall biosynthesis
MPTTVDVIIPVYNEEEQLAQSVTTLRQYLKENMSSKCTIVIADNGSTDKTLSIADALSLEYPDVRSVHIVEKGRGRALRQTIVSSQADVISYMDVDLSTHLNAFPALVKAIEDGYDISIGSRLMSGANTKRCFKRELTSRVYNVMVKAMFFTPFCDAQCGFKAISHSAAQDLVPLVQNNMWFFDTELLILASRKGYKIKEIPVTWVEDPGSKVKVVKTAKEDIKGLLRMRFKPLPEIPQKSDSSK